MENNMIVCSKLLCNSGGATVALATPYLKCDGGVNSSFYRKSK